MTSLPGLCNSWNCPLGLAGGVARAVSSAGGCPLLGNPCHGAWRHESSFWWAPPLMRQDGVFHSLPPLPCRVLSRHIRHSSDPRGPCGTATAAEDHSAAPGMDLSLPTPPPPPSLIPPPPQVYSVRTQSRAVHIFHTLCSIVYTMSETAPQLTSSLLLPALPDYLSGQC